MLPGILTRTLGEDVELLGCGRGGVICLHFQKDLCGPDSEDHCPMVGFIVKLWSGGSVLGSLKSSLRGDTEFKERTHLKEAAGTTINLSSVRCLWFYLCTCGATMGSRTGSLLFLVQPSG